MTQKEKYVLTGRYMRGAEVVGYHIISECGNKQKKLTREQFIFILGRGLISNCTGQIYGSQVILRGSNGVNISDLPIYDEKSKSVRNAKELTHVKPKDGDMAKILDQVTIVARLMCGRKNIGFEVRNYGGQIGRLPRGKVIQMAENKLVSNAVVQNYNKNGNTKKLIRGVGVDFRELPTINVDELGKEVV